MANIKSAQKRARQNVTNREHNVALLSRMRTAIKKVLASIEAGNASEAQTLYQAAVPDIDKMANKGLIHPNKAARHKSRLAAKIKAL